MRRPVERSRLAKQPRPSAGVAPYVAAAILALLTAWVWGPLTEAPISSGAEAGVVAFAVGALVAAVGHRAGARGAAVTTAVVTAVVLANFVLIAWGIAHSH